ncbi:MAG: hypothetical protein V4611_04070 [Patescibacteria group bacterium]
MVKPRKKILVVVIVGIVLVLAVGAALYWNFALNQKSNDDTQQTINYEEASKDIQSSGMSDAELATLVADYGSEYDKAIVDLRAVSPDKWAQTQVDAAYMSLLYTDKIGAYAQVQEVYYMILSAQAAGVDVDDNSAGVTKEERDSINAKVDAAQGSDPNFGSKEVIPS